MRLPDFDGDRLRLGEPYAWAHVVAAMLFPGDERARQASEHALGAQKLKEVLAALLAAGKDEPVDAASALWMAVAPHPHDLVPRRSYRAALIAGATLNFVRRAAEHAPHIASVGVFLRGLAAELARTKKPNNSIRTLKDAWARYRSVAHLWAGVGYLSADSDVSHLAYFLAVAEDTRRWGETYIPRHGREPVLDAAGTWKVPPGLRLPYEIPPPRRTTLLMVAPRKKTGLVQVGLPLFGGRAWRYSPCHYGRSSTGAQADPR